MCVFLSKALLHNLLLITLFFSFFAALVSYAQDDSPLKMRLAATVLDVDEPRAIIEDLLTGQQEVFYRGESVFGRGVLSQVTKTNVVVLAEGRPCTLGWSGMAENQEVRLSAKEQFVTSVRSLSKKGGLIKGVQQVGGSVQIDVSTAKLTKAVWAAAVRELGEAGLPAYMPNTGIGGVPLVKLASDSILLKLGFQPSDVIRFVNGVPVDDSLNAVKEIVASPWLGVSFIIERGGERIEFSLKGGAD